MEEFDFPIEKYLGETFYFPIGDKWTLVTLVDAEKVFNDAGLSCGFIHFANPVDLTECLGYGGVNIVYDTLKANGDIE